MLLRVSIFLKKFAVGLLALSSLPSFADTFGSNFGGSWADTPKGRFECLNDASTNYSQRISVGGLLIYQERRVNNPYGNGGPHLSNGILAYDPGCPDIVANQRGYIVIVRATQPPHYGINGYGIIDFNRPDLPVIELGQAQYPRDSKVKKEDRLVWSETSVTLKFFGYLVDEESASKNSLPAKLHEVRYSFSSGKVEIVK